MRSKWPIVYSLWIMASLAGRTWAGDVPTELPPVITTVTPGDDLTRFWNGILDQAKPYVLIMDVRAGGGRKFAAGSAQVTKGGRENWVIKENSETRALFQATVPPRQALGKYKPVFTGLFQPAKGAGGGGGGGGGGGKPEVLTWKVTGIYEVSDHVYENSGALKGGNPTGAHKINPVYEGIKTYDVDVPVKDANGKVQRMQAVDDELKRLHPGEEGSFEALEGITAVQNNKL